MRGDELAWCAGFVLFCFDEADDPDIWDAGIGVNGGKDSDYWKLRKVSTMKKCLNDRGLGIGRNVVPAANDIIFFGDHRRNAARGSHVGIVEHVELDEGKWIIHTIEGNLSNKVKRARHVHGTSRIIGFARVIPTPALFV
jgi:hypothetical protein